MKTTPSPTSDVLAADEAVNDRGTACVFPFPKRL